MVGSLDQHIPNEKELIRPRRLCLRRELPYTGVVQFCLRRELPYTRVVQLCLRRELPYTGVVQLCLRRKLPVPGTKRGAILATGRSEGDIMIRGVGGDSGEPEGRIVRLGDGSVVR